MKIYLGFDNAEREAYRVAAESLRRVSNIVAEPLNAERLAAVGLCNRLVDKRGHMYDLTSNAACSTEFATSRFLVPLICQTGFALFCDCDVIFYADPRELLSIADSTKAVMVVKHNHIGRGRKMGGMLQTNYPRKNWSSVMLFNCDHPANRRLSLRDVQDRPGRDLHAFYWLHDDEIGELPAEWNWLVNVTEKPENPKIAHFTNGGPWIRNWGGAPYDQLWLEYAGPSAI